jgi:hypothetical protein
MAEPRSPLKEFRHLEEKLRTVGLSTVEHARWESLRALVAPAEPAPGPGARDGGFDVDAAAAALRASLQPAGLGGRAPSVELVPEPGDAAQAEWRPSAATAWAQAEAGGAVAPAERGAHAWPAGPVAQASDAGWAPAPGNGAGAAEGAQPGWDSTAGGWNPGDAEAAADASDARTWDPNAVVATEWDPGTAQAPADPGAAQPWDPGAVPQPGWDPNAVVATEWDPGTAQAPADPGATQPWDPGAVPQPGWDPNAVAQADWDPSAAQAWDPSSPATPGWDPNAAASAEWDPNASPQAPWNAGWSPADAVAGLHDPSLGPDAPPPSVAAPALGEHDAEAEATAEWAAAAPEEAASATSEPLPDPQADPDDASFQATAAELAAWDASASDQALPLIEEVALEEISAAEAGPAGSTDAPTDAVAPLAGPGISGDSDEAVPLELATAAEFIAQAGPPPAMEAALDVGALDLAEIPEVSADEVEEVVEALAAAPAADPGPAGAEAAEPVREPAGEARVEPAEPVWPGTAGLPSSEADATPFAGGAAPPLEVAGPEVTPFDEAEIVSLEEIVITPPPPMAEALAPPLPPPAGAGVADPGPPFVAPPVLVPAPAEPPAEPWVVRGAEALADAAGAAWAPREDEPPAASAEPAPWAEPAAAVGQPHEERFPEPAPELLAPPPFRTRGDPSQPSSPVARPGDAPAGHLSLSADEVATPLSDLAVPPASGEASWGSATTFVSGEHRVVLHTVEGQVVRGTIVDSDLVDAEVALHVPGGDVQRLPASRLKAVFFMLAPGESPPSALGTKVRVTFGDGRQLAGMSPDYAPGAVGFFVVPAESRTNTGRIWVYRDAIRQISVG